MRTLSCAVGVVALSLAGCAGWQPAVAPPFDPYRALTPQLAPGQTGLLIRYESKPDGAIVFRDGVVIGRTPFVRAEPAVAVEVSGQAMLACTSSEPVMFVWASGASTTRSNVCTSYPTVVATRPDDAPGLEQDLRAEADIRAGRSVAYRMSAPQPDISSHVPAGGLRRDPRDNTYQRRGLVSGTGLYPQW